MWCHQLNQAVNSSVLDSVRVHKPKQTVINQDFKQAVYGLDVVNHVPFVTTHGQPQK